MRFSMIVREGAAPVIAGLLSSTCVFYNGTQFGSPKLFLYGCGPARPAGRWMCPPASLAGIGDSHYQNLSAQHNQVDFVLECERDLGSAAANVQMREDHKLESTFAGNEQRADTRGRGT